MPPSATSSCSCELAMQLPNDAPATVFEAFARTAARHGEKPFLAVLPETAQAYGVPAGEIGYGEALARIGAQRDAYRAKGYGAGHRVGILMENRPGFFLHWFALNSLGVSVVPINPDLRSVELEYLIGHSELIAIVAITKRRADLVAAARTADRKVPIFAPDAEPVAVEIGAPRSDAPGVTTECGLLYTSGTTGRPKGCVLPNEYFLAAGHWYLNIGGLAEIRPGAERLITPLPMTHMNAMAFSTMVMILSGGCIVPLDRFHPATWWESVRVSGASIIHYLGVMPAMLMSAPAAATDRDHHVRFGFGAGVSAKLHAPFESRFGFPLLEAWAMTETGAGGVVIANREPRKTGTACFGRAPAELDYRIVDDSGADVRPGEPGELLVRASGPEPR